MTIIKKNLQFLQKEIKALEKKMDKLIAAAEKSDKSKTAKKSASKPVKAKTTSKAPAKKGSAKQTATDQVLKIIKRSKKPIQY